MVRIFLIISALLKLAGVFVYAGEMEHFRDKVKPMIDKHCVECHGEKKQKGALDLSIYGDYEKVVMAPEVWKMVMERIQAFEMPPEGRPDMGFDQRKQMVQWLEKLPQPKKPDCDEIASDRNAGYYRGYVMSRPLNRAEYNNTMRDLLGVDLNPAELLPSDGGGGEGFDTSGNALFVSSIHVERFLAAAEKAVDTVLPDKVSGLQPEIRRARKKILITNPPWFGSPRPAAKKVVTEFARRAYRRVPAEEDVEKLMTMFDRASKRGDGFVASVRLALKAALVSPSFLFLVEPEPAKGGVAALAPFPLASRLSYFLWSSMPDDELLGLAASGGILQEEVYRQQVRRMLKDPKAQALGKRFALQWLDLEKLGSEVKPDSVKFPEFSPELNQAMLDEVTAYFNHIVRMDRSLVELIDSKYTFINPTLARLYGLPAPVQAGLKQVSITDSNRGGILGMAAVHTVTSFPGRTSAVLRGRWILDAFLGEKVPPPPPDVPALDEEAHDVSGLSLREQLESHRKKPDCIGCHKKMDPLGFGLENFDVLGRWRETDRNQPIDARGTLPSGENFTGPSGLKSILMARKDDIIRHLTRKLTGYALGRELTKFDDCVVDRAMKELIQNDYRASVLVEQIVLSFPFRHRFYAKIEQVAEAQDVEKEVQVTQKKE